MHCFPLPVWPCLLLLLLLLLHFAAADELGLRLNSISQRLMLALQLIPIQKATVTNKRLVSSIS
jgi:hypothetical protein